MCWPPSYPCWTPASSTSRRGGSPSKLHQAFNSLQLSPAHQVAFPRRLCQTSLQQLLCLFVKKLDSLSDISPLRAAKYCVMLVWSHLASLNCGCEKRSLDWSDLMSQNLLLKSFGIVAIDSAGNFCLIGSSSTGAYGDSQTVHNMLGNLWASISLEAPPLQEQLEILLSTFPSLPCEAVVGGIATLRVCQIAAGVESWESKGMGLPSGWNSVIESSLTASALRNGELAAAFGRHFSLRDMFCLCTRMTVCALSECPNEIRPNHSGQTPSGLCCPCWRGVK